MTLTGRCAALAVGFVAGCSSPVSAGPGQGTLSFDWSVGGVQSREACSIARADAIEVVVTDAAGGVVADLVAACEDFRITARLGEGTYGAEAALRDVEGNVVEGPVGWSGVRVSAGADLAVTVDFGAATTGP